MKNQSNCDWQVPCEKTTVTEPEGSKERVAGGKIKGQGGKSDRVRF